MFFIYIEAIKMVNLWLDKDEKQTWRFKTLRKKSLNWHVKFLWLEWWKRMNGGNEDLRKEGIKERKSKTCKQINKEDMMSYKLY